MPMMKKRKGKKKGSQERVKTNVTLPKRSTKRGREWFETGCKRKSHLTLVAAYFKEKVEEETAYNEVVFGYTFKTATKPGSA